MYSFPDVGANPCFKDVGSSSGVISSSITKNYSMYDCTWIIRAPSNHTVKLNFTVFNLRSFGVILIFQRSMIYRSDNYRSEIKVYDGKRKNETLLGIFSGSRRPFIVQTSGQFMMVTFKRYGVEAFFNFKGVYSSSSIKGELYVPKKELKNVRRKFIEGQLGKTYLIRLVELYHINL